MHIPASMLNGAVCPVTVAVSAAGTGLAIYAARKSDDKPSVAKFAAVTALVFALEMLNFPVQNGTSGHLVGAMLAVALLGIPCAIISMAVVLAVQSVFFADGGINALGANILNMGLLGAGLSGLLFQYLKKHSPRMLALGIASWFSVVAGALACSFEVAWSGSVALNKVLPAMLGVHTLIGLGETALTLLVFAVVTALARKWHSHEKTVALASLALAMLAALFSPFASSFPDGLEWVSNQLAFTSFPGLNLAAWFPDYRVSFIGNESLSTICAGLAGVGIILVISHLIARFGKITFPSIRT